MAPAIEPPELAALVDYAERSREGDWSLRSALVRYAQPEPQRVSQVLELVRRIDFALHPHAKRLAKEGPALWSALSTDGSDDVVVGLLHAAKVLDDMTEHVVAWAVDRHGPRPDAEIDAAVAEVTKRLDDMGVPREERTGPPRRGGRGT